MFRCSPRQIPKTDIASDVLIVGSSIHVGSWLKKSKKFITNNAAALKANPKPTWAFSVGMPPVGAEHTEEKQIEEYLKKKIPIRGHKLFQGRWERGTNGWCVNFFFTCFGGKYEDRRDWDAMDKWADEVVNELRVDAQNNESLAH